jgi:hypothetical protein
MLDDSLQSFFCTFNRCRFQWVGWLFDIHFLFEESLSPFILSPFLHFFLFEFFTSGYVGLVAGGKFGDGSRRVA